MLAVNLSMWLEITLGFLSSFSSHRAILAFMAICLRLSGVRARARATPPFVAILERCFFRDCFVMLAVYLPIEKKQDFNPFCREVVSRYRQKKTSVDSQILSLFLPRSLYYHLHLRGLQHNQIVPMYRQ